MNGHSDGGRSVDISKIPTSVISGLKKGKAKAALLHSEDLEDEDNEVWILQCPKNIDLAKLIEGKKLILDPDQPTLLSDDNGQDFDSICVPLDNEERNIATVLPDRDGNIKIVSTKLSGHIMLRESVSELPPPSFNIKPPHSHQLPPGLKHRHPVYGTDFTKILCKMENDSDSDLRKSGKHKKHKRRSEVEALPDTEADANSELCLKKSKKHEKRKRMSEIEVLPEIEADSEPCLKKLKKHEKRKRMSETEVLPEIETESEPCLKKRKKHEKRKRMSEIEVLPEIETD